MKFKDLLQLLYIILCKINISVHGIDNVQMKFGIIMRVIQRSLFIHLIIKQNKSRNFELEINYKIIKLVIMQ